MHRGGCLHFIVHSRTNNCEFFIGKLNVFGCFLPPKVCFFKKNYIWGALLNSGFSSQLNINISKILRKFRDEQCTSNIVFIGLKYPTPQLQNSSQASQSGRAEGPRGPRQVPGDDGGSQGTSSGKEPRDELALSGTSWPVHWSPAQDAEGRVQGGISQGAGLREQKQNPFHTQMTITDCFSW